MVLKGHDTQEGLPARHSGLVALACLLAVEASLSLPGALRLPEPLGIEAGLPLQPPQLPALLCLLGLQLTSLLRALGSRL